jgi:hypothetical protein
LLLAIIIIAWQRGLRCCTQRILPLGWFSLMFVVGTLLTGVSESGLGENQAIQWVLLNVLSFSCGLSLARQRRSTSLANEDHRFLPAAVGHESALVQSRPGWAENSFP